MANEKNLKAPTSSEARENGRKGGIKSGEARRARKQIRSLLSELLEMPVTTFPQFEKIAVSKGIDSSESIKVLFAMVCLMHSIENGTLSDLEKLVKLLGETTEKTAEEEKQANFLQAVKEAVGNTFSL